MTAPTPTRRRLAPAARREQLVRAAMRVLVTSGPQGLSFDAVAGEAHVTRNLLYHYFPDVDALVQAVAERAGHDLSDGWATDPAVPIDERRARNFAAMAAHAGGPSDAWAAARIIHVSTDPKVRATYARYRDRIVDAMALNAFGPAAPTPMQRAGLESYLAFAESLLDATRTQKLPADVAARTLTEMLEAVVRTTAED